LIATIKDNKKAELIIKEIAARQGLMPQEYEAALTDLELVQEIAQHVQLDAMVARPALSCNCGVTKGAGRRASGYVQVPRFKWLVHVPCKRPTQYIVEHWIQFMMAGARDLLGEIIPSHEEVTDNLDRGARFRVYNQELRDGRRQNATL